MPASKESPAARYRELAETVSELRGAVSELRARVAELARRAAPAPAPAGRDPFPAGYAPPPPPAPSPFAEDDPRYVAAMISSNPRGELRGALRLIAIDNPHPSARADAAKAGELLDSGRSAPLDAVEDARQARLAAAREQSAGTPPAPMGAYLPEGAKAPVQVSRPVPGGGPVGAESAVPDFVRVRAGGTARPEPEPAVRYYEGIGTGGAPGAA
jgi:hypothetical protein